MSHCVSDWTIWRLSEGETCREERAHVASCRLCAARLRRLEQELGALQRVFAGSAPSQLAPTPQPVLRRHWATAVATVAAMVMCAWFGVWWRPSLSPLPPEAPQASFWPFIEGVSTALFPDAEIAFSAAPDRLSDLDDLRAALAWEWPCEGRETLDNWGCDNDTFALLLGEL